MGEKKFFLTLKKEEQKNQKKAGFKNKPVTVQ
jgi:hypothetical protein